ncbi:hypothetical protein [Bacillus tropicus]|uniref:hypothetical protein n=1 Tax=Bacillus tropicus TaxID=2026188 RepID=UPI003ED89700
MSRDVEKEIKQFHHSRLQAIQQNKGYCLTDRPYGVLIHVIPIQSFLYDTYINNLQHDQFTLNTFGRTTSEIKIHFDGIYGEMTHSYHHINRQGIVEIVDNDWLSSTNNGNDFVKYATRIVSDAISNLDKLDGSFGPYFIHTVIYGTDLRTFTYNISESSFSSVHHGDMMHFPCIKIEEEHDIQKYTKMVTELLINAAGTYYTHQ